MHKLKWMAVLIFNGGVFSGQIFAQEKSEVSIKFSGYLQGEYRRITGEGANVTESDARRARFKVDVNVSPNALLVLQLDLARIVELRDAYADLSSGRLKARVGQFKVPLSSQILESSSTRLSPERALINTRSVPGERDRGVLFDLRIAKSSRSPVLQFGVFNGRGLNQTENNTDKDFIAALHMSVKPVSARVAYLNGKYRNPSPPAGPGTTVTKSRLNVDLQFDQAPLGFQAQYAVGEGDFPTAGGTVSATHVQGGYAQASFRNKGSRLTVFVGYQLYDPDTDANDNTIGGPHAGLVFDGNKSVRYTMMLERLDNDAIADERDLITLRAQVKF